MRKPRLWLRVIVGVIVISALTPSFVRAYKVNGPSDAPTLLWNDLVLVNMAAYDLNLPFSDQTLISCSSPEAGNMILFQVPGEEYAALKRIVAVPGDNFERTDSWEVDDDDFIGCEKVENGLSRETR